MKNYWSIIIFLFFLGACKNDCPTETKTIEKEVEEIVKIPEKIDFPSLDSILVVANLYHVNDSAPVIVLCHQARFNKFEYNGIAKTLHENGFNCLAIDQRSGGPLIEEFNETKLHAEMEGKPTDFLDAEQDIIAAINYAAKKYNQKVILWGSSYSSTLAVHVGTENENVKAIVSFSPGNYFDAEKGNMLEKIKACNKPMWLTSSKPEAEELSKYLSEVQFKENQMQFVPDSTGEHGSRALWKTNPHHTQYWNSLMPFLEKLKISP